MISEQDNSPEAVKGRVRSITKTIRYKARKEGGNMIKAFNDHMSTAGSGIGAAERQMIKKSLGLSEKFSNWRSDLIEVMGEDDMEPKIKEKKIKNKIRINPEMSEEFKKIGGTVVEMLEVIDYDENYKPLEIETIDIIKPEPLKKKYVDEADMSGAPSIKDAKPAKKTKVKYDPHMKVMAPQVEKEEVEQVDEYASMSPQEVMLQKKKAQLDVMIAKKRKQTISKAGQKSDEPTKTESVNEEESDAMKDKHLQRAGMGARANYKTPPKNVRSAAMSDAERQKSREASQRAFDFVKKSITDKYGKGSLIDTKKEDYKPLPVDKMEKQYAAKKEKNRQKDRYDIRKGASDTQIDKRGNSKQTKKIASVINNTHSGTEKMKRSQSKFKSDKNVQAKNSLINTVLGEKENIEIDEKCWPGYRVNPKRKTKILFGKRYPNCEKAK